MKMIITYGMLVALTLSAGVARAHDGDHAAKPTAPPATIDTSASKPIQSGNVVYSNEPGGVVYGNSQGNYYGHPPMAPSPVWRFHPAPGYAHGFRGIASENTHEWNQQQAMGKSWHGRYYHRQWGAPLALVVPPTVSYETTYSWGVGQTRTMPVNHQFARPYPGPASNGGGGPDFRATPVWPSSTNQFGVYPVRAPW